MVVADKKIEKEVWHELVQDFSAYGSVSFNIVALLFFLFIDLKLFARFAVTLGSLYVFLIILRSSFFMGRPKGKRKYKSIVGKIDYNSKFSSHAASSFVFAITVGLFTNTAALIFLLVFAFFIDWSRIYLKKHYPINVLTGSILGIIVSLIVNLLVF